MKDLYLFFLKNLIATKIKRSFRGTCHDQNSTSTLNQHSENGQKESSSYMGSELPRKSVTLEEMILQLELEEAKARREKAVMNLRHNNSNNDEDEDENRHDYIPHRMSCVNSSDILRSARNALNQYPRFSLDGRDAMYRSSFHRNNMDVGRAIDGLKLGRILHLPQSVGGESVIWCKPGVVPKLMGLDAMPLPISRLYNNNNKHKSQNKNKNKKHSKEKLCDAIRNQNLRRRVEKNEIVERKQRRHVVDSKINCRNSKKSERDIGGGECSSYSCSSTGHCLMNPVAMEPVYGLGGPISWPTSYNYT